MSTSQSADHWSTTGIMPWPCAVHHLCCRHFPDHRKGPPRSPRLCRRPSSVYLSFRPIPSTNQTASVTAIEICLAELRSWMISNMLMVNDSKTEFLIVGTLVTSVRNLGVIFDSNLKMDMQITKSLPKRLLTSPQHQGNPKIPEPGSHVHDYTCVYYKPDWLLQQFDEWTTREYHQESSACEKHSCQTIFQS